MSIRRSSRTILKGEEVSLSLDLGKFVVQTNPDRSAVDSFFIAITQDEKDRKYYISSIIQALDERARLSNPGPYDTLEQARTERKRIVDSVRAGNYELIYRGRIQGIELRILP
jgi:aromatic ring-opening dioxygenase LigB subunit